ncbi:hypothetical protein, partial [Dyella subtropica]|uniref:hypothetical protein n=1 Tax=Dyella subtropica TaxID=2992127 RepID=UPI002258C0EA
CRCRVAKRLTGGQVKPRGSGSALSGYHPVIYKNMSRAVAVCAQLTVTLPRQTSSLLSAAQRRSARKQQR